MSQQPTKTDNKSIGNKIFIRKKAISNLPEINVLDLFGGNNVLWKNIYTDRYFGVEKQKDKGNNLVADSRRIFDSLDLSKFNVIDVDSYGISFDIYKKILTSKSIRNGTVIIYTAITNQFTKIQNEAKDEFGFRSFYNKAPSLFNARAIEFFYEFLAKHGIDRVTYYEVRDNFTKHYGYFRINK
ncbi:MAG: hypothetical protein K2O04_05020 [Clostridiales bacterium]|nr:hypothetical protein [Clostridiales bacterium]